MPVSSGEGERTGPTSASWRTGPGNEDRRLAVFERHRDVVKARINELESALGVVEHKITTYGGACGP